MYWLLVAVSARLRKSPMVVWLLLGSALTLAGVLVSPDLMRSNPVRVLCLLGLFGTGLFTASLGARGRLTTVTVEWIQACVGVETWLELQSNGSQSLACIVVLGALAWGIWRSPSARTFVLIAMVAGCLHALLGFVHLPSLYLPDGWFVMRPPGALFPEGVAAVSLVAACVELDVVVYVLLLGLFAAHPPWWMTMAAVIGVCIGLTRLKQSYTVRGLGVVAVLLGLLLMQGKDAVYAMRHGPAAEGMNVAQSARVSRLERGQVLAPRVVADLMPPSAVKAGMAQTAALTPIAASLQVVTSPGWMLVSNNPEVVHEGVTRNGPAVLYRGAIPAGPGRLYLSHFYPSLGSPSLLVRFRNTGSDVATLTIGHEAAVVSEWYDPMGLISGVEAWNRYQSATTVEKVKVGSEQPWTQQVEKVFGNVVLMEDVTSTQPLEVTVALGKPAEAVFGFDTAVEPRSGPQSRGLFPAPDRILDVTMPDDARVGVVSFNGPWLDGQDGRQFDTLAGNYGCITHVTVHSKSAAFQHLVILLVPRGGPAGAVIDNRTLIADAGGGIVIFNGPARGDTRYDFSLPANSYAPVDLVLIPVRD